MGGYVGFWIVIFVSYVTGAFSQTLSAGYDYPFYYYPYANPHPPPPPPPPPVEPVATGFPRRATVGIAVGTTFAATVGLFGLGFFLFMRFRKRKFWGVMKNEVLQVSDGFLRVNSNLKGVIVDENGLDVLYLKKMESNSVSFRKEIYRSSKEEEHPKEEDEQEKRLTAVNGKERRKPPQVQEIPLLQGKSSTSDSPIWSEKRQAIPPPFAPPPPPPPATRRAGTAPISISSDSDHSRELRKIEKGFEGDIMEALFGSVATNRKSPRPEKASTPSEIFILDPLKSQSAAVLLKSLGVTSKEITNALIEGRGLNTDAIEKLAKAAPNQQEASQLGAFNGDPTRLAEAESFFYNLIKTLPSAITRLNVMLFRATFDSKVLQVKESLQSIESASKELRASGLFLKLLEAVLKSGDRLSSSTSRGNSQKAFNITALNKLSDVKSYDGKTTLLHFVVQEITRSEGKRCLLNKNRSLSQSFSESDSDSSVMNADAERDYMTLGLPIVGGLSSEFSNVKKAATLDHDALFQTLSSLAAQMSEVQAMLVQCGAEGRFAQKMQGFLETAEFEMKLIQEEQTRVMELVKETTDYYYAGSLRDTNPLYLFVIASDFLTLVDQACVEIARNVQKRKPGSSFAERTSTASPRVFKFPKLPASFMADTSQNSSSDKEKSPQVR